MKSNKWLMGVLCLAGLAACQKANNNDTATTLTASATQATVGQTVSVQVSSNNSAVRWTVTPSASVAQTYTVTNQTVNYFTFSQAGTYTIGVRTRNIMLDSTHQPLDSCWHQHGGDIGGCHNGVDSASVKITVVN
jgi:hypothetical protein